MLGLPANGAANAIRRVWGSRKRLPIGMDIGSQSIRMMQLQQAASGAVSVAAAAIWRFPRPSGDDPSQRRAQAMDAVARMLRSGGFKRREVVSALPCSQMGIRNVRLPQMPAKELRDAVRWEAKERFSFEVGDDQLNYIDAGEVRSGNDTAQEVVLLAADKQVVEDHVSLLAAMKLRPVHIDAAPIAMFRMFDSFEAAGSEEQGSRIVVEVGEDGTRVVVARGGQIVFVKSLDMGGAALTAAVAKQLNLSADDAWQLRQRNIRSQSAVDADKSANPTQDQVDLNIHDALRGVLESLAKELALCLRYCSVTFRGLRPSEVILCGGEAYDPTVTKLLAERLNLPCVVGRPLRQLDTANVRMDSEGRGIFAEWAVCAGLAVRCLANWTPASEVEHGTHRLSA